MSKSLIIFAREPRPTRVKTRLAASIGDQAAAGLYERMLRDVLENAGQMTGVVSVTYWACEEELLPLLAGRFRCNSRCQSTGDLGRRMRVAFEEMFGDGYETCCIIGSDAPDLPSRYIQEAFETLAANRADVVFGPASDGGYYLLGMKRLWPQLFAEIPWSTPQVLERSLQAAEKAGARVHLLPVWHDIDTLEDLLAYRERTESQNSIAPGVA